MICNTWGMHFIPKIGSYAWCKLLIPSYEFWCEFHAFVLAVYIASYCSCCILINLKGEPVLKGTIS